jgi:hypothetical protein
MKKSVGLMFVARFLLPGCGGGSRGIVGKRSFEGASKNFAPLQQKAGG